MAEVLFVCVHNAGRSQMAKATFNRLAANQGLALRPESAGTELLDGIHEVVSAAMDETGLDLRAERPKLLTDELAAQARRVVTMGCAVDAAACPSAFLKDIEDWRLPEPKGQPLDEVRSIRDAIGGEGRGVAERARRSGPFASRVAKAGAGAPSDPPPWAQTQLSRNCLAGVV